MRLSVRIPSTLLLLLLAGRMSVAAPDEPFEATAAERKAFLFFRVHPDQPTPSEQFAYAKNLAAQGELKRAARQFDYLVATWPGSPEAPHAATERAVALRKLGKLEEAFNAYQDVITRYPGDIPYEGILTQQLDITREIENRRSATFGFFRGFHSPEKAVPFYETLSTNAPGWEKTPEILHRIGEIQRENWKPDEALVTFDRIIANHPGSPWAERAAYSRALVAWEVSEDHPNHADDAQRALSDLQFYLDRFNHANGPGVAERRSDIFDRAAVMRQRVAAFAYAAAAHYDHPPHSPATALAAYETFVREHKSSSLTPKVEQRIRELRQALAEKAATP